MIFLISGFTCTTSLNIYVSLIVRVSDSKPNKLKILSYCDKIFSQTHKRAMKGVGIHVPIFDVALFPYIGRIFTPLGQK